MENLELRIIKVLSLGVEAMPEIKEKLSALELIGLSAEEILLEELEDLENKQKLLDTSLSDTNFGLVKVENLEWESRSKVAGILIALVQSMKRFGKLLSLEVDTSNYERLLAALSYQVNPNLSFVGRIIRD